jgi:WD40 repeat protein
MRSAPAIPDHTLLRPIGKGAYGQVWLARNVMGTLRAVKVVERRQFDSDRPFEREFAGIQRYEPVSRSAAGLVHVLHVGRKDDQGYFYYVMELADDAQVPVSEPAIGGSANESATAPADSGSLGLPFSGYSPRTLRSDLTRLGRLPVAECLQMALDVVGGLARLHDRGLVHRDVKPGNIIFVDGRAKLADLGLVSTEKEGRTFVGTEGYIPPEGPGSPTADLFALGMVLYEAATGYSPERFPQVPAEWFAEEAGVESLEFHEVVLKACEGVKERRYQSAEEMQADLALLHSGQSVRHLRALEKRVHHWRRIGGVAGITVALALAAVLLANWRARVAAESRAREADLREKAQKSLARAENAEQEARQQLYTALLEQARATVRSGELGQRVRALDAVRRAAAISNSVELRREVLAALSLPDLRFERELPTGPEPTLRQLDPKFERIALGRGIGPVEIRATADNQLLATLAACTNLPAYNAFWSRDGRFLSVKRDYESTGSQAALEVWAVAGAQRVLCLRDLRWGAMSFHPHKSQILTAAQDGWITAWSLEGGRELARAKLEARPDLLAYSPHADRVAASYPHDRGWQISIHRVEDWARVASHFFTNRIWSLEWHPEGRWLAASDAAGRIHRLDTQTGENRVLGQHKAEAVTTAFSPDGAYLFSGGWERELVCWDAPGMRRALTIGLDSFVLRFRDDGRQCALLTPSGVQLHSFERPAAHRELGVDLGPRLRYAAFSPDGRLVAASADNRLVVWDLEGNGLTAVADEGFEARPFWAPDGRELYGSRNSDNGTDGFRWQVVTPADVGSPPRLERLPLPKPDGFTGLSLSSNSVVLTSAKGSTLLPLEQTGTGSDSWVQTSQGISGVSPDGRWLGIYPPFARTLDVYRLPGLQHVATLPHPFSIGDFQFSPLGDELAVASRSGLEFWNTRTWAWTRALTNFIRILYSPDARTLWLDKDLRTSGLYDARTLQPLLMLPTGTLPLDLSPDGRQLAVSVDRRRLQVWDLQALRAELASLGLDWKTALP